jgi:tRNA threonylcarbamoyladenosine biosynthesis protein TsaE
MNFIQIPSPEALPKAASEFVSAMDGRTIFAFRGKMGVGKTTFIRAICRALGVEDVVNSPSFALVNEYWSNMLSDWIYHFDFYRINSPQEAREIGIDEYFSNGGLCLIEWPEKIESLLPPETVFITMEEMGDGLSGVRGDL